MAARPSLLIVDDELETAHRLGQLVGAELHADIQVAGDLAAARAALRLAPALVVTDLRLPDGDGTALVEEAAKNGSRIPVIVMTGVGGIQEAVRAMQAGALDFLEKPIDTERLVRVVGRALRERALEEENSYLHRALESRHTYREMVSKSPAMRRVFELVEQLGQATTTALIIGETGTGKERLARAVHEASSAHRSGPLVAVNCAAVPEALFESDLFGHEKGSFTGAADRRKGKFELAQGGTLFLDEIGEMPLALQPKLLRALQERQIERVGGTQSIPVDVRVVAATNRELERLVRRGKFREDLFYRLNVVRIDLPPLRERPEDIPLLVQRFAERFAPRGRKPKAFTGAALQALLEHPWPGNIRELENLVERVSVTVESDVVQPADLDLLPAPASGKRAAIDLSKPLATLLAELTSDVERRYIERALAKARGNVGHCADICGLSRRSVSAKLSEYGLDKKQFKVMR